MSKKLHQEGGNMKISDLVAGIKDNKILQMALKYGREEYRKGYIEGKKGTWLEDTPGNSQLVLVQVQEITPRSIKKYPPQPEVAYYSEKRKDWDCNALGWLKQYNGLYKVVGWQPISEFGDEDEQGKVLQTRSKTLGV